MASLIPMPGTAGHPGGVSDCDRRAWLTLVLAASQVVEPKEIEAFASEDGYEVTASLAHALVPLALQAARGAGGKRGATDGKRAS